VAECGGQERTTLRFSAGLLYPTAAKAGLDTCRRGAIMLPRRITMVMGNRNQLQWDLPALDSFELNRAI